MITRIEKIIKEYNLTSSIFADEIKIQRAQISHILSGRNNASLDIVQKILMRFPRINSEWLLIGIGKMFKDDSTQSSFENKIEEKKQEHISIEQESIVKINTKKIEKILVFYNDNSFDEYHK
jgi:plasmid maintenance system antidote protein VapI